MRKTISALATVAMAAGLSLAGASPASAADYCFGPPSEPLAYVCISVGDVGTIDPTITWSEPSPVLFVPSVCYGVGCTGDQWVYASYPTVSGVPTRPTVSVYWNGYTLPGDAKYIVQDIINNIEPICFTKPAICVP